MSSPALVVRDDDPTPPFEQVRRQIAALVAAGALAPDQRLPPVRQLAADLGLAVGTVARAYRELEAAGVVSTRRGAGTRVAGSAVVASGVAPRGASPDVASDTFVQDRLETMARDLVVRARAMGVRDGDLTAAVREAQRRAAPAPSRAAPSRPAASSAPRWRARPAG